MFFTARETCRGLQVLSSGNGLQYVNMCFATCGLSEKKTIHTNKWFQFKLAASGLYVQKLFTGKKLFGVTRLWLEVGLVFFTEFPVDVSAMTTAPSVRIVFSAANKELLLHAPANRVWTVASGAWKDAALCQPGHGEGGRERDGASGSEDANAISSLCSVRSPQASVGEVWVPWNDSGPQDVLNSSSLPVRFEVGVKKKEIPFVVFASCDFSFLPKTAMLFLRDAFLSDRTDFQSLFGWICRSACSGHTDEACPSVYLGVCVFGRGGGGFCISV